MKKNLTKIMTAAQKPISDIKKVKYFDDLTITAASHKHFPCAIQHRRTECQPDRFSLEMLLNGEVDLLLDSARIRLRPPCVFWIGDHHKYFQFELVPGQHYDHWWIDFSGERGRRIYESLTSAFPDSFVRVENYQDIRKIFEHFARKFKVARRPAASARDVILIEQLLLELSELVRPAELSPENDPHGILSLAEQIRNAPFEPYDLRELAKRSGLSYVHFRTLFKANLGESVWQYILKQQMLTAGVLLKSHQFRIGELSDYCGFSDLGSFSRAFKRYYHLSPKQWLSGQHSPSNATKKGEKK
ncbi:MAG: helix-turn-helix transcriptional regulator [Lentisphaeria bacterium]|nr:helix-turn-helix transcriptional regulator [Lentisphaeria bacterium]